MSGFQYVSSVEGHLVTRFPSLRSPTAQYIGATRKDKKITWDTNAIIAISDDEWKKFRREYRRAVEDGALTARTEAEYKAFIKTREQADNDLKVAEAKESTEPTEELDSEQLTEDSTS